MKGNSCARLDRAESVDGVDGRFSNYHQKEASELERDGGELNFRTQTRGALIGRKRLCGIFEYCALGEARIFR